MRELTHEASAGDYAHSTLILLAFALFATDNLVHYPLALMSVLGVFEMLRAPRRLGEPSARALLLLFALIWVPMLIALTAAVDAAHSGKTVLLYLHFLPAAYYLLHACAKPHVYRLVTGGVVVLVVFTAFDAFAQLIWSRDFFGYPYDGHILKGVFHPKQRLGLFLGVFAPLYIDVLRRWCANYPALWLVLIPIVIVVLMTLKRSAWVMLVVGVCGYIALRRRARESQRFSHGKSKFAVIIAIVLATALLNPSLRQQLATSAGVFSDDIAEVDRATSYRVSLWRTGLRIFKQNWLIGIGPRGYRSAYAAYAPAGDFWIARGATGQTHPHLLMLEVAIETGVLGAAGLAMFYVVLWRLLMQARDGPGTPVWLLCAAVAWLPINTHLSFYGSYWATLVWLFLGIGLAIQRAIEPTSQSPA